ncbi:formylglycine-generating enzyme family protein [Sphingomonas dokdonensis]|uniref:Serine/threonine-protein kinase pkn1 n=1 Tax=Sphingomonas dokdonensis TaxID=344880 RepID=A0A245ZTS3_9SPHN|nr:formylglycine-generating enzyme family protein [Sphingomonas dokdonensis]OWK33148.1 serine/threonine-protein kinase pkn1 [Sphingomonas dokdonensis]
MIQLDGGTFLMGSARFYPEEAPVRRVRVDPFAIDETPVTNADFEKFINETGYVTVAEIAPDPANFPGMDKSMAVPGSLVFEKPSGPVDLGDPSQWWRFRPGASWHQPLGAGSTIHGLNDHPVVHVAFQDAQAYAAWAGKSLPSEAEWEFAARGGLAAADYAWGDDLAPDGVMMANYWQGLFPFANQLLDGFERTSPVRSFPPNGFGLYDLIGNVWEWTDDWYAPRHQLSGRKRSTNCCSFPNPRGGRRNESFGDDVGARIPRKVLKGGSHLCAANYCQRYRPAARHPQAIDTSTSHIGFRCIRRYNT